MSEMSDSLVCAAGLALSTPPHQLTDRAPNLK